MMTDFKLRMHHVEPKKGFLERHRIVFEVTNNETKRSWFYASQVVYDEHEVLQRVEKFARLRVYENSQNPSLADEVNQLVMDNFFHHEVRVLDKDNDGDYSEHHYYRLHPRDQTTCNPMTKMEYGYFYYLATNYYKKGTPESWGLVEPNVSM